MGMGWRAFFAALHVVALVLIACLIAKNGFVEPAMFEEAKRQNATDALHLALQVGRLDIVSLMLAMYAIFAGVAAVFGFIEVRYRAENAAAKVAAKVAADEAIPEARRATIEWLESLGIDWTRIVPKTGMDSTQDFADALNDKDTNDGGPAPAK